MSEKSNVVRPLISVLLVVLTVLGLMNVYSDNSAEVKTASDLACGGEACETNLVQMQRSVLGQSFVIQARPSGGKGESKSVDVECARQFVFFGEYRCVVK